MEMKRWYVGLRELDLQASSKTCEVMVHVLENKVESGGNMRDYKPSRRTTLGWSSLQSTVISLTMNRMLSDYKISNLTFFNGTTRPVTKSRALYTLLYVPESI